MKSYPVTALSGPSFLFPASQGKAGLGALFVFFQLLKRKASKVLKLSSETKQTRRFSMSKLHSEYFVVMNIFTELLLVLASMNLSLIFLQSITDSLTNFYKALAISPCDLQIRQQLLYKTINLMYWMTHIPMNKCYLSKT